MSAKKIIISVLVLVAACAGIYAWNEFNRKHTDLMKVKASHEVDVTKFIHEFASNDSVAAAKYLGKVVAVKGAVKHVERDAEGSYTIVLGDTLEMSAVRCSMDSAHVTIETSVQKGAIVNLKGICTGFKKDATGLLGSDVEMNRCVIAKNK